MSQRWLRHNIVGNEAHRPRPIAYLHGGWGRRRRPLRRSWVNLAVLLVVFMAAAAAVLLGRPWS